MLLVKQFQYIYFCFIVVKRQAFQLLSDFLRTVWNPDFSRFSLNISSNSLSVTSTNLLKINISLLLMDKKS